MRRKVRLALCLFHCLQVSFINLLKYPLFSFYEVLVNQTYPNKDWLLPDVSHQKEKSRKTYNLLRIIRSVTTVNLYSLTESEPKGLRSLVFVVLCVGFTCM